LADIGRFSHELNSKSLRCHGTSEDAHSSFISSITADLLTSSIRYDDGEATAIKKKINFEYLIGRQQ